MSRRYKSVLWFFSIALVPFSTFAQIFESVDKGVTIDGGLGASVTAMEEFSNSLIISGSFDTAGSFLKARGIARWDGNNWDSVGLGIHSWGQYASSLYNFNNKLYVAGGFNGILQTLPYTIIPHSEHLGEWDGTSWSAVSAATVGNNVSACYSVSEFQNDLYVGGTFTTVGNISVNRIARWDGSNWHDVAGGVTGSVSAVKCMRVYHNSLYVGGQFTHAGGLQVNFIARWDGIGWSAVGGGLDWSPEDMVVDSARDILYVVGGFTQAGGNNALQVAQWNGITWSSLDTSNLNWAYAAEMYRGNLFIGTYPYLYKWDGFTLQKLATVNEPIMELKVFHDSLFIGGYFDTLNNVLVHHLAKYYEPLSNTLEYENGNIVVAPNPFTDHFTIILDENIDTYVYLNLINPLSISPCIWSDYVFNTGEIPVNCPSLSKGLYILMVRTRTNEFCRKKLIVE